MKKRLLVIDGHNLLFQMFFGMPSRIINRDGVAIQGVIGFIGALGKIIRMTAPTHAAIIFDSEGRNARCDLFPEYKANRPDFSTVCDEENPFTQLPFIYRALDYIGIPYKEAVGCECDDVIASYASLANDELEVYISSYDSDYFQLISDNVKVFRYKGDASVIYTPGVIKEKYGVLPSCFALYKALVGDKSDNIPGVRGIGPKTAAAILAEHTSLDDIISNISSLKNDKIRAKIEEGADTIRKNLELIELSGNAPIPYPIDNIKLRTCDIKTMEIIRSIGL